MLGTMMMALQGEAATRPDGDALDLETRTAVHGLIPAPGAVDAQVLAALAMAARLDLLDQQLDALRAAAVGDQHGVARCHNHQVVDVGHRHHA